MLAQSDFWPMVRNTAVWWSPIVAGFIGAFGVHLLTQSRERERWILENKKQEYRELLSALSNALVETLAVHPNTTRLEALDTRRAAQNQIIRVFSDRIFIVRDLNLTSLRIRWRDALFAYTENPNKEKELTDEYEEIRDEIVKAANCSIPKTAWQCFKFWRV
jgi:hypothetical protein